MKLVNFQTGLTHTDAFQVMGLVCEERQKAYMEGYDKGYSDVSPKYCLSCHTLTSTLYSGEKCKVCGRIQ